MAKPMIAAINSPDPARIGQVREAAGITFQCVGVDVNIAYAGEDNNGRSIWTETTQDFWEVVAK